MDSIVTWEWETGLQSSSFPHLFIGKMNVDLDKTFLRVGRFYLRVGRHLYRISYRLRNYFGKSSSSLKQAKKKSGRTHPTPFLVACQCMWKLGEQMDIPKIAEDKWSKSVGFALPWNGKVPQRHHLHHGDPWHWDLQDARLSDSRAES